MSTATCLVTGGAGFIGSHVAAELLRLGRRVVVLDDLSGGFRDNVPDGAEFVEGSILDHALIEDLFARSRFDYVFHLAAYAAEGLSHYIKRFNYRNNLIGSVNLINASVNHDVKCFVFTSSIAVYGAAGAPMHEDAIPSPCDSYGIAKYAVERELAASHEVFGLDYVVFRPHNVYGEHQNIGDGYRNVVGIFMNRIMRGEPLLIFGDGTQTRAFTYVGDIAPAIAASVEVPAARCRTLNIGAEQVCSVNELAAAVMRVMRTEAEVIHCRARNEVLHAYCDHAQAERVFGPFPFTSLEEGLARMASWARSIGPRPPSHFDRIEVTKNLPPSWRSSAQRVSRSASLDDA